MIYENIDEDNYLSQSEEILQTERCMEDGRFLDTVILTKTNLPRTNLPFSMDAFVIHIESDLIEASTKISTRREFLIFVKCQLRMFSFETELFIFLSFLRNQINYATVKFSWYIFGRFEKFLAL